MRYQLRKQLVAKFKVELERRFPHFSPFDLKGDAPNINIWAWQVDTHLAFFISLSTFFDDDDRFTVEIAWNESNEFPWLSIGKELRFDAPRWRDRFSTDDRIERIWDLTPEVTKAMAARWEALDRNESPGGYPPIPSIDIVMPRIGPLVDECLTMFEQVGLPIFRQVAKKRGIGSY